MTALQYRTEPGARTQDIELNIEAPKRIRLQKRRHDHDVPEQSWRAPHQVGASIKLHFDSQFYAGIGVCSHNQDVVEKAELQRCEAGDPPA